MKKRKLNLGFLSSVEELEEFLAVTKESFDMNEFYEHGNEILEECLRDKIINEERYHYHKRLNLKILTDYHALSLTKKKLKNKNVRSVNADMKLELPNY